ncbi:uncharacterized protein LOC128342206 isoform X2 [Hemicordylus capensis]|uniref:uncharacterized protein LOC128342206 isoform X2 n=1 Tax=Hemicordylus capensis TaxID=884348 RepID=UPI0023036123|nr:uncharacterized protein LOC128342206 isoform X2 [Hemicordylus capensis]
MEERLEAAGKAPHVIKVTCLKDLPKRAAPQNGKQQPEDGVPQQWVAQCQEFLKALDSHCSGWGNRQTKLGPWDDAKAFLASFEQVAEACQWPRGEWVARLLPALSGETKQAYNQLEARDKGDYEKVKAAILQGEAHQMETLRQLFRQFRYQEVEDPRRIYGQLRELCHQWLKPEKHTKEQILDLLILEQFLAILPQDIQSRIRSWDLETSSQIVAEEFLTNPPEAKTWEWQVPLEEVSMNPSEAEGAPQGQIYTEAKKKAEEDLCLLASGIMSPSHPSSVLPPEEQEVAGAGLTEGPVNLNGVTVALENAEWAVLNPSQGTMHWEVMQENSEDISSLGGFVIPKPEVVSQMEQEEMVFVHDSEDGKGFPGSLSGDEEPHKIKKENFQEGRSEPEEIYSMSLEISHGKASLVAEIHEQGCESNRHPGKKPLEGWNETIGVSEGHMAAKETSRHARKKNYLAKHQRIHAKPKLYQCSECGESFSWREGFVRHRGTHTGEKPHECSQCGKCFSQRESLIRHEKIHTGKKPYECPECGKNFCRRDSLKPTMSEGDLAKCAILDGKYFTVLEEIGGKVKAKCELCGPGKSTVISGSYSATTNFKTHLKRVHPGAVSSFEEYKVEWSKRASFRKRQLKDISVEEDQHSKKLKQTRLSFGNTSSHKTCSQNKFDVLVTNFVVNGMRPLSIVEDPDFVNLFQGMDFGVNVMSRQTLAQRIHEMEKKMIFVIKQSIEKVPYVCTTADIWSAKSRSFLGVTAHWIDERTYERCSAVLACKRFRGSHTYDKIAEMLDEVNSSFGLTHEKIVSTITDNGSNFMKAFKEFGVALRKATDDYDYDDSAEVDGDSADEFEFTFINDQGIVTPDATVILPHHNRCSSYTLNLIATTDTNKVLANTPSISRIHHPAMAKCWALWNASSHLKSAEELSSVLEHKLSNPCVTRWNSLYDLVCQIIRFQEKLPDVLTKLNLKCSFKEMEFEYLKEYTEIFRPLAVTLDLLQGDNCYYGQLLPTLFTLRTKLEELETKNFRYCGPLLQGVKANLYKRFEKYFHLSSEVNEAIIAACTHPFFKLRWLPADIGDCSRKKIQELLINSAKQTNPSTSQKCEEDLPSTDDKWFCFDDGKNSDTIATKSCKTELEILQFLQDKSKHISMLDGYPIVRRLFFRYNTSLTSSGPVEWLFSFAGMIHSPRRHNLSDLIFEKLVLLKGNGNKFG